MQGPSGVYTSISFIILPALFLLLLAELEEASRKSWRSEVEDSRDKELGVWVAELCMEESFPNKNAHLPIY